MHGETKGDADKDGRCRGVYSSVMQLYDALFYLAWMVFMIPFLGQTGMKEDRGFETDRGHIDAIEKHFAPFIAKTMTPFYSKSQSLNQPQWLNVGNRSSSQTLFSLQTVAIHNQYLYPINAGYFWW